MIQRISSKGAPRFTLLAASLLLAGQAMAAGKPNETRGETAACPDLIAAGAEWEVCDNFATGNGLPAGDSCDGGPPGAGANFIDASFGGRDDAFDEGGLWVNNMQVGGLATFTLTSASFAAQSIAGLTTQLRVDALSTQPTLRAYLSLSNPSAAPISVNVDYAINLGSDSETMIHGSSSGDTLFTAADRWLVTSDGTLTEPVNTSVLFSGSPSVQPSAVSNTVFSCSGTQGVRATYPVTVPAGATVAIVIFQSLGIAIAPATTAAAQFNDIQAGSPLLAGLSPTQTAAIRNIGGGGGVPPVATPPIVVPVGGFSSGLLALILGGIGLLSLGLMRRR